MDERIRRLKQLFWMQRDWTVEEASEACTLALQGDFEEVYRLFVVISKQEWVPSKTPLDPDLRRSKFNVHNTGAFFHGIKHIITAHLHRLVAMSEDERTRLITDHPTTKFMEAPDGDAT